MTKKLITILSRTAFASVALLAFAAAGCEQDSHAEDAVEEAQDNIEDAAEEVEDVIDGK